MNFGSGFAIYFIIWWLSFLLVLPFRGRTQEECGEVVPGTVSSAPARPTMGRHLIAATLLAAAIFTAYSYVWANDLITLDDFPIFDPPSALRKS